MFAKSSKSRINFDFSRTALQSHIDLESRGIKNGSGGIFEANAKVNAFTFGQNRFDLHIAMWSEDIITGCLLKGELFLDLKNDPWLGRILLHIEKRLEHVHMNASARVMREDLLGIECQNRGLKWNQC